MTIITTEIAAASILLHGSRWKEKIRQHAKLKRAAEDKYAWKWTSKNDDDDISWWISCTTCIYKVYVYTRCLLKSAEVHHRQTPACAECRSTSRHRHSEVRPWLGTSSLWRLALARRSRASSVQARSDSSSVSMTQSSPVPGGLLYVRRWRRQSSASTFRQSSSAHGVASPSQHVWSSGLRSGAGLMSWNSLPNSLRESACDSNISDDCFKHSLKTFLLTGYWRTECSRGVHDSALYQFTFTYFTYLLT